MNRDSSKWTVQSAPLLLFLPPAPLKRTVNLLKWPTLLSHTKRNRRYLICMNLALDSTGSSQRLESSQFRINSLIHMADSWRHPRWASHRLLCDSSTAFEYDSFDSVMFDKNAPALVKPPKPPSSKRLIFFKVLCAGLLLGNVSLAWIGYYLVCNHTREHVARESFRVLGRPLEIGRIVRVLPTGGLRLGESKLLRGNLPSTTPELRAMGVDIWCQGLWEAISRSKSISLNASIQNAKISVYQKVVLGKKGKDATEWDPGIPSKSVITSQDVQIDSHITSVHSSASPGPSPFRIQLGKLNVLNSTVFLHTGTLPDYGHHGKIVEVRNVSAFATFPKLKYLHGMKTPSKPLFPFDLEGEFRAELKAFPVGGGSLDVAVHADAQKLFNLKPGDDVCDLHVKGQGVAAGNIAAFLSLPFRAEAGECCGDVRFKFFHRTGNQIPNMSGFADLRNVALRFHPDPKTPEFTNIDGKLRFDRKDLFLDGPTGSLGTLPMTVVGNISLDGEYNLVGYIPSVDVNNILETFDVEKFTPISGHVRGEARMKGILEEPVVVGWAETTNDNTVFDRLPLKSAGVEFSWEAIPGIVKFTDIHAKIHGGGTCIGTGGLYFDMTKESPYGMNRPKHHINSPKAAYWNPGSTAVLPGVPDDVMEIDELAPQRPYDSMRFDFKVEDVKGSDLLRYYGGKYGGISALSIGNVEGTGILAGHSKDSNCRVAWRSVSLPPDVQLIKSTESNRKMNKDEPPSADDANENDQAVETANNEMKTEENNDFGQSSPSEESNLEPASNAATINDEPRESAPTTFNMKDSREWLGGGEFQGLVYIKLGDLPAARRIKARTTMIGLDARRLGWLDPSIQITLSKSPRLNTSLDSYFTGVMYQRPIIPPGADKVPRTPRMELLGADGALAVRNLAMNEIEFPKPLTGSFSFSSSDFSMSLKEVSDSIPSASSRNGISADRKNTQIHDSEMNLLNTPKVSSIGDELTVSASLQGEANITFRRAKSEMVASLSKDKRSGHQIANIFARGVPIQDFLGTDYQVSGSSAIEALLDTDFRFDLTDQKGKGSITLQKPRIGPFRLVSLGSDISLNGRQIVLSNSLLRSDKSEFGLTAVGALPIENETELSWDADLAFTHASLQEVIELYETGKVIARSFNLRKNTASQKMQGLAYWVQLLSNVTPSVESDYVTVLDVPDASLKEQVAWFQQYLKEERSKTQLDLPIFPALLAKDAHLISPNLIQGRLSGSVHLSYKPKSNNKSLIRMEDQINEDSSESAFDTLRHFSATFDISGYNWKAGSHSLSRAFARGRFLDNTFSLGTLQCENDHGFYGQASGYIRDNGKMEFYGDMKRAPAALLARLSRAPVTAGGEYSGRFDIKGNLLNPEGQGKLVWTNATLNGQALREARSEVKFENGRCGVNVFASIGMREGLGKKEDVIRVSAEFPTNSYLDTLLRDTITEPLYSSLRRNEPGISNPTDKRVRMLVDIRKFGLVFLNAIFPDLGWTRGSADVNMEVSGSLRLPIVKGRINISDAKMWPQFLTQSVDGVKGDVLFDEAGTVSVKSLYGRCGGKGFYVHGDMLLSEIHGRILEEVATHGQLLSVRGPSMPMTSVEKESKRAVMTLIERKAVAKALQDKVTQGLTFEMSEVPVCISNVLSGAVSGKVTVKRNLANPEISGSMSIHKGAIHLSNGPGIREGSMGNQREGKKELRRAERQLQFLKSFENLKRLRPGQKEREFNNISDVNNSSDQSSIDVPSNTENSVMPHWYSADFREFNVSLGREVRIIYPFLLDVEAQGKLELSGDVQKLEPKGTIQLSQGFVNLLASRMNIKRGENSYVRFGDSSGDAPIVNVALEDDDVIVRVHECTPAKWADHLEIKSKRGGGTLEDDSWSHAIRSKLEDGEGSLSVQAALLKIANSYVSQVAGASGGLGSAQWRVHPILGGISGESSGDVAEDLGIGANVNMGKVSVSLRTALSGVKAFVLELRPWKWLSLNLGADGERLDLMHAEIEIQWSVNDDQTSNEDQDKASEEMIELSDESLKKNIGDGDAESSKDESTGQIGKS